MSNDRLHIAHIVHRFDTGGLENGVVNLINTLGDQDYQHSIITLKGYNPEFAKRIKSDNVQFFDLAKKDGNDLGIFWRLNSLLKQLKPDVLHTRNTATLELQLVGWWRRVSLRIHGEHGWDVNDMHGQNLTYRKLRRLLKPFIHQYIALSTEAKDYLLDIIKVAPEKVNHICNGVDTSKFDIKAPQLSNFPIDFLDKKTLVFGTVGRLAEVKNQTFLLKSFIQLLRINSEYQSNTKLLIVGDGIMMPKLKKIALESGFSENILFTGDRSDVCEMMNCMNVFVLPSLAEGISNTILEAMACGLPIIATAVGGNGDLILPEHKPTHLIESENVEQLVVAMQQYLNKPPVLIENSKAVREHCINNFSIDTMVAKYHHLYQSFSR
jgi:sugar transferase (PEP-CTERM/EpsH1 system associated)